MHVTTERKQLRSGSHRAANGDLIRPPASKFCRPSARMIHRLDSRRSFTRTIPARVDYFAAVGRYWGFETDSMSRVLSSVIGVSENSAGAMYISRRKSRGSVSWAGADGHKGTYRYQSTALSATSHAGLPAMGIPTWPNPEMWLLRRGNTFFAPWSESRTKMALANRHVDTDGYMRFCSGLRLPRP